MGPRYGAYALLEARRLGLALSAPKVAKADQDVVFDPPTHWDLDLMREGGAALGPDARVGQVHLQDHELHALQGFLTASYRRTAAGPGAVTEQRTPSGLE